MAREKGKGWRWERCANCGASGLSRWRKPTGVYIFIGPCCRKNFGGVIR